MRVVAISMVKDELDIAPYTVAHMLTQVDDVYILDNNSQDGTGAALAALGAHVTLDPEIGYYQAQKLTHLAYTLSDPELISVPADWIVPFDADEYMIPVARPHTTIKEVLEQIPLDFDVVEAVLYDHVATALDPATDNPLQRLGWRRRSPAPLSKMVCRTEKKFKINQGNHDICIEGGANIYNVGLVIRHFPYRSAEQLVSKVRNGAAAYAATDLPEDVGAHWRQYGAILDADGPEAIGDIFREWFWSADPASDSNLMFDPVLLSQGES